MPGITAGIVIYKNLKAAKTIDSFLKCREGTELIIVDNSPTDELKQSIKRIYNNELNEGRIQYIFSGKNLGYGGGQNVAYQHRKYQCKYHVVLNPDVVFTCDVLAKLSIFMDQHAEAAVVMPRIINTKGENQALCKLLPTPLGLISRRFFPKAKFTERFNRKYTLLDTGYNTVIDVPSLSGCFLFIRAESIKSARSLFDPRFFLYMEDFDLIRRLRHHGQTLYYPFVEVTHEHAKESYHNYRMLIIHLVSAIKYFNKYGWFFDRERRHVNKSVEKQLLRKL
jgi:GT2 family glycosyltransferase